jgi:hypothetical protein
MLTAIIRWTEAPWAASIITAEPPRDETSLDPVIGGKRRVSLRDRDLAGLPD